MAKYVKRFWCFCFFLVSSILSASSKQPEIKKKCLSTLSLHQAIDLAYQHKPNLQQYKYFIQASKINEKQAWSGYYPFATLKSSLDTESGFSNLHSTVSFNVDQLIYRFDGPQELAKRATRNTALIRFQQEAQKNDLRLAVELAFLEGWRQQQQKVSIKSLHTSSKAVFKVAENSNRLNLLDKNDWLKAGENHTADIATVFNYHDSLQIAQKSLEFLLGYSTNLNFQTDHTQASQPNTRLIWKETEIIEPQPLIYYEQAALANRPEIKAKQKQVEVEEVNITLARNSRLPVFGLSAVVSYDNAGAASPDSAAQRTFNSIGVGMTFPIFDQLKSDYDGDRAQAQKMAALLDKQETMQEVKRDVAFAYHQLSQALTNLKAEKFRYQRAENEFQLNKLQYEIGNITKSVFETATYNWETERLTWINQRIDVEKKQCQLMHDCGYQN